MLELAILGLLKERPMHGYDLRKRLRNGSGLAGTLSFGSLYPALARLERAGAVRELLQGPPPAPVIPLTGSLSGEKAAFRARLAAKAANTARAAGTRGRKVYELTPLGEQMFATLLVEDSARAGDDRAFALRWSFARHLSSDGRLRLLARQRRTLEDRLGAAETSLGEAAGLDQYERQLAQHVHDCLVRELFWIDSLIAAEQKAAAESRTETEVS